MKKTIDFFYSDKKKMTEENKVPPVPQIIVNDISVNIFNCMKTSKPYNKNFLFPSEEKRSRSFSPSPTKAIEPPRFPSKLINVRTKKAQFLKRKSLLLEKRENLKQKSLKILSQREELTFLKERNNYLLREIKNLEINRNKRIIFQQLQKDYTHLNELFLEVLMKKDQVYKQKRENDFQNQSLRDIIEMKIRKNRVLKEFLNDFQTKFQKFKFFEELTIINLAIQKQDQEKKSRFFLSDRHKLNNFVH